jgi:hypothetical protein
MSQALNLHAGGWSDLVQGGSSDLARRYTPGNADAVLRATAQVIYDWYTKPEQGG